MGPIIRRGLRLLAPAALAALFCACGAKPETIDLAGLPVPKAPLEVSIGTQARVGEFDSQTATYSGAKIADFDRHIRQLEKAGWRVISRTQTVNGLTAILSMDRARGSASWAPNTGLIVNIQAPRATPEGQPSNQASGAARP